MKYVKKTFAHKLCAYFVFTSYVKKLYAPFYVHRLYGKVYS